VSCCNWLARNMNLMRVGAVMRPAGDGMRVGPEPRQSIRPANDGLHNHSAVWHQQAMDFVAACNR